MGSMLNYLKINIKNNKLDETFDKNFINEKIVVDPVDYYYSNVISRASKTMNECRKSQIKIKSTGTDG